MRLLLIIAVFSLTFGMPSAKAAKRVAFVIGNDSYKSLPELNNARMDARGMAAKLKELGWSVILKQNASRRDISRSLADFEGRLQEAEVGLFFYAGHGIQKDGASYLVPSDAQIEGQEDLRFEGILADEFLEAMERAGSPLNIVILDACRDNPLPKRSRSGSTGLRIQVVPKGIKGTAILYSASPGQVAQDGPPGGHGVFTGELLKVIDRPGLKLEEVFKETATQVAAVTNGRQDPWFNSSVKGDFYFREGKAMSTASALAIDKEAVFWKSIADSERVGDYQAYLSQYPNGTFAVLARSRLSGLIEQKTENMPLPSFTVEAMDETLVALKSANARELPTASSKKIGQLPQGTDVAVTGKTQFEGKTWYRVAHYGRAAYVFGSLLGKETMKTIPEVEAYPERYKPGSTFKDCDKCPEMVVIPSGSFRMGDLSGEGQDDEKPVRFVRIDYSFAVGKYEVTQGEFGEFIAETSRDDGNSCYVWTDNKWGTRADKSWKDPGYNQSNRDPVACVNWNDAKAYVEWMSTKTGKQYRLLSEAEWEYMARAGSRSKYPFGSNEITLCKHGNGADQSISFGWRNKSCNDGFGEKTAPVGSYNANAFGVHDTVGNVWEWLEDCWHDNYTGAPSDGSVWSSRGDCSKRVLRGGSWDGIPTNLRSANRSWDNPAERYSGSGFRIARTLAR